jgi:alpha-1,6-mannosyltransferase
MGPFVDIQERPNSLQDPGKLSNHSLGVNTSRHWYPAIGLGAWLLGLLLMAGLDDPRRRFLGFFFAWTLMTAGWLVVLASPVWTPRWTRLAFGLGLAARLWAIAAAPAFSEDVFRYVFEGRVALWGGPGLPFQFAPALGPEMGLPPTLLDGSWLRINHPHIPTIYPPLSQAMFVLAALLGSVFGGEGLLWLKLLLLTVDLGTWALLTRFQAIDDSMRHAGLIWGLSPLIIVETCREGHADVLSAACLALGIYGFKKGRQTFGQTAWAFAALAKLNGVVPLLVAVRYSRRISPAVLATLSLLLLPFLFAGNDAFTALLSYASRWRAGDGIFGIALGVSRLVLGGDYATFGDWVLTQHQLARGAVVIAFLGVMIFTRRKTQRTEAMMEQAGFLLLLMLLLSPTLYPWYVIWLMPFVVTLKQAWFRPAAIALVGLCALLHHPSWLELIEGTWQDLPGLRALVHVPVWGLLVAFCPLWKNRPRAPSRSTVTLAIALAFTVARDRTVWAEASPQTAGAKVAPKIQLLHVLFVPIQSGPEDDASVRTINEQIAQQLRGQSGVMIVNLTGGETQPSKSAERIQSLRQLAEGFEAARDTEKALEARQAAASLAWTQAADFDGTQATQLDLARTLMWLGKDAAAKATLDRVAAMTFAPPDPQRYSPVFRHWLGQARKSRLEATPGTLDILCNTPSTVVSVDGKPLGLCPLRVEGLVPGVHHVHGNDALGAVNRLTEVTEGRAQTVTLEFPGPGILPTLAPILERLRNNQTPPALSPTGLKEAQSMSVQFVLVGGIARTKDAYRIHSFLYQLDQARVIPLRPVSMDLLVLTPGEDLRPWVDQLVASVTSQPPALFAGGKPTRLENSLGASPPDRRTTFESGSKSEPKDPSKPPKNPDVVVPLRAGSVDIIDD